MEKNMPRLNDLKKKTIYTNVRAQKTGHRFLKVFFIMILTTMLAGFSNAQNVNSKSFVNLNEKGVILDGYDAVAYFTDNKAIKGDEKFSARYNGATYWFYSEEHAGMFNDNPGKFAPQYGSFCGYAMSLNKLRPVDPTIFQLVDGRLILQHTKDAYTQFNKDVQGNKAKADAYWPGQVKKHEGKKVKFDKPAKPTGDIANLK